MVKNTLDAHDHQNTMFDDSETEHERYMRAARRIHVEYTYVLVICWDDLLWFHFDTTSLANASDDVAEKSAKCEHREFRYPKIAFPMQRMSIKVQ